MKQQARGLVESTFKLLARLERDVKSWNDNDVHNHFHRLQTVPARKLRKERIVTETPPDGVEEISVEVPPEPDGIEWGYIDPVDTYVEGVDEVEGEEPLGDGREGSETGEA
jgi:hypothetical protein